MHVVYVTQTCFLDTALSRMRALSEVVDLSLVLELSPDAWKVSFFDLPARRLPEGLVSGDNLLGDALPSGVSRYWQGLKSADLAVFNERKAAHPRAMVTSQAVARAILAMEPDVIHLDESSLRLAWGLWRLRRIPTVMTIHDPRPHSGEGGWRRNLSRKLSYRQVTRFILQSHDGLTGFSAHYRVPCHRIDVTLMGSCDVLRDWVAVDGSEDRPVAVLCFGRMSPYKGLDVLEEAASIAAGQVPELRVIVAGAPVAGFRPPAAKRLVNGGTFDVIPGHIETREAARLFARARVVVLPYREATQSGVVLSAFAFGIPVVASNTGGIPDYVTHGENGLLVTPGDPQELAAAIVRVMSDDDVHATLLRGVLSTQRAGASWDLVARQHVESYIKAIQSAQGGRERG